MKTVFTAELGIIVAILILIGMLVVFRAVYRLVEYHDRWLYLTARVIESFIIVSIANLIGAFSDQIGHFKLFHGPSSLTASIVIGAACVITIVFVAKKFWDNITKAASQLIKPAGHRDVVKMLRYWQFCVPRQHHHKEKPNS